MDCCRSVLPRFVLSRFARHQRLEPQNSIANQQPLQTVITQVTNLMMSVGASQASLSAEQVIFGVVITGTFVGQVVGAVYSPETKKVYLLPKNLFEVDKKLAREAGLSRSRMLKMEENLAFGECVRFFANEYNIVMEIIGHGRQPEFFLPQMIDGHLTLKVLGVVSKEHKVWTEHLGFVEYPEDTVLPLHDVPIECFVLCDYSLDDPFVIRLSLHAFGLVARLRLSAVHGAPWNQSNRVFAPLPISMLESDDEDDDVADAYRHVADPEFMKLDHKGDCVQLHKDINGVLFFETIYSAQNRDRCYHLVFPIKERNSGNLQPGTLVRFDAYYSDIHCYWIVLNHDVYRNKINKSRYLINQPQANPNPVQLVFPASLENNTFTTPAELPSKSEMPGVFYNTHLAYVSDRRGVFSTLVPKVQSGDVYRAKVAYLGFAANRVCHFETISVHSDLLKEHEYASSLLNCLGYIAGNEIICPMHVNVLFTIDFRHDVPPGTCVEFQAELKPFTCGSVTYRVRYFDQAPAFCEKYDLDVTEVDGMPAIICNAYLNTCRNGDIWSSPLFGPIEDVHNIITGKRTTDGKKATRFRVVIVRDRQFNRSSTMFYIQSLAPEGRIEKFQYERARIEDLISHGKSQ